jgi:hypothetical protein
VRPFNLLSGAVVAPDPHPASLKDLLTVHR